MKRITELAHHKVSLVIKEGDRAIDATAGNGNDSVFLAEKVGSSGHVFAFDVQEEALEITGDKLNKRGLRDRVTLLNRGHEDLSVVAGPVSVVMYNLGYLPGGNHAITTKAASTMASLNQALHLIEPGGLVTIILYPGHEPGRHEKEVIISYCNKLASSEFTALRLELINQANNPPELLVIQKVSVQSIN